MTAWPAAGWWIPGEGVFTNPQQARLGIGEMAIGVRCVITGYGSDGSLEVASDRVLQSLGRSPAGEPVAIWAAPTVPVPLDSPGTPNPSAPVRWLIVKVPPDSDRGPAANDFEAGILHEGCTTDLVIVISGEVWLELDGMEEWVHLKAGDTVIQRGTKHAWHNPTDAPAYLSCVLVKGTRTKTTPSRLMAADHDFRQRNVSS